MFKKTDLICDVLEQNENAEEILTDFGFHCIYCPAAQMESLEEASYVHGVDVDELLKALNACKSAKTATKTTKTAAKPANKMATKSTKTATKSANKTATKSTAKQSTKSGAKTSRK